MERRRASFLFHDKDGYTFMDSETLDQHTIAPDTANLACAAAARFFYRFNVRRTWSGWR